MPPQVGRAGEGSRPITQNPGEGVQEIKSAEVEQKPTEKPKDTPNHEVPVARQASAKEASDKKCDIAVDADYKRRELDQKLKEKPITIKGTAGNDTIHISKASNMLGDLGFYEVKVNNKKTQYLTEDQLKRTQIKTGDGNDRVIVDSDVKVGVKVDGGSGNDLIVGGSGNDQLVGGKGKDLLFGRAGDDKIRGGEGNDYINGGRGFDLTDGGPGFDFIKSGADFLSKNKKKE